MRRREALRTTGAHGSELTLHRNGIGRGVFTGDHAVGRLTDTERAHVGATGSRSLQGAGDEPRGGGFAVGAGDTGDLQLARRCGEETIGDATRLRGKFGHGDQFDRRGGAKLRDQRGVDIGRGFVRDSTCAACDGFAGAAQAVRAAPATGEK
jgi:hypothetical protein